MTLGVKAWNDAESVPASWTDYTVLEFWPREIVTEYDSETALDGEKNQWSRTYLKATISVPSPSLLDATTRAAWLALLAKKNFRFKDTRHASLGDANTIRFAKQGDAEITRAIASMVAQELTIEFISGTVV